MEVAHKDPFLERPDVSVQEVEPLGLEADLVHVDIARRHVLVAALQTPVLQRSLTHQPFGLLAKNNDIVGEHFVLCSAIIPGKVQLLYPEQKFKVLNLSSQ